jgi:hypothetical protein
MFIEFKVKLDSHLNYTLMTENGNEIPKLRK